MNSPFSRQIITHSIDWLACTFKEITEYAHKFYALYPDFGIVQPETARNGYTSATRNHEGIIHMWSNDNREMGHHIVFAGSALKAIYENRAIPAHQIVLHAVHAKARISRLDVARDIKEYPVNLDSVWNEIEVGIRKGTARKMSHIKGTDGSHTIYVGGRTSERFMRIYDKAKEQAMDGIHWVRMELELKGEVARAFANNVDFDTQLTQAFNVMAKNMVDLPHSHDYQMFFPESKIEWELGKIEKITDRERWIKEQVISAVAKHFLENPDSAAVADLRRVLDAIDTDRLLRL